MSTEDGPFFLTMTQAADRLGNISAATLYRLARTGDLPVRRIGRKIVISTRNLERWADEVDGEVLR